MEDNALKKEKYIPPKFERIKTPVWKVKEFKDIIRMAIPIFVQLAFNVLIAQINVIAINWYMQGVYSTAVSKAVLAYNTLQFIPSLIATGTIIVCGNLIGQGRQSELSKVVLTGLIINFAITSSMFIIVEALAPFIVKMMDASDKAILSSDGTILVQHEITFVTKYYRLLNIQLLVLSINQIFIGGLQAMKKSLHVTIGAVASNFIDAAFVAIVLFAMKVDPMWSAISLAFATSFQTIYMMIMNFRVIDFKVNKGNQLNKTYAIETIKTGLPITLEMGLWFVFNFVAAAAIAKLAPGSSEHNDWLILHRSVNGIGQFSFAFTQSLGTVSAVFVARKIGEQKIQDAYEIGIDCWKTAVYASLISGAIMLALTWPILEAYNEPIEMIWPWGFIIFGELLIKQLFDTVNLTLLRSLWAAGDLWYPIWVSVVCMGLGIVVFPLVTVFGLHITGAWGLFIIYFGFMIDPLLRSIIYIIRWLKGKWQKYVHIIQ